MLTTRGGRTPVPTGTQVDVLPIGPEGAKVAAVNYFRDVATFLEAPVSPVGPAKE